MKLPVAIILLMLSGCWSVTKTTTDPRPYAGVRSWAETFNHFDHAGMVVAVLTLPDVPLSFMLDTLLLPFTLPSDPETLYGHWPHPEEVQ